MLADTFNTKINQGILPLRYRPYVLLKQRAADFNINQGENSRIQLRRLF